MTTLKLVATLVLAGVALAGITGVVEGGESRYLSGTPDLRVSLTGGNEFFPGDEQVVTLYLENQGVDTTKLVQEEGASGEPPSTAMMVTAALLAGNAPVVVKTDPQLVGTIPGGSGTAVPFTLKVFDDAQGGDYLLLLNISYTTLMSEDPVAGESVIFHYAREEKDIALPFVVRDVVSVAVPEVRADELTAGGEGYVTLLLKNTGSLDGRNTVARISRDEDSPVIPVTGSVFIGDFPPGAIVESRFRVRIAEDAGSLISPVGVLVDYEDDSGEAFQSKEIIVGVPIKEPVHFRVSEDTYQIYQGATESVSIEYENTGSAMVYGARARISAIEPFTATVDTASLGDLAPGDRAVARFAISADNEAAAKNYALDTEVRYRDGNGENRISDPVRVTIAVQERTGISRILYNPVIMSVIIAGIIGAGYYVYSRRKKQHQSP